MEARFDGVWSKAERRYFVTAKRNDRMRQEHHSALMPFEERIAGFCRRLYYIPHCKVLEAFETDRVLGEKLGLNTREDCWFYEKWKGSGDDRVFVRSWKKGQRQWGDVTTSMPQGYRVSYWKEDGHYRCFGEYEKTATSEITKIAECSRRPNGDNQLYSESITKTPSGEFGEKLQIASGQSEHTKWEIAKHSPGDTDDFELDFVDLRTKKTDSCPPESQPESESQRVEDRVKRLQAEHMRKCMQLLQEKGYLWSGFHSFEHTLNTLESSTEAGNFYDLLSQVSEEQIGLITELVAQVMLLSAEIKGLQMVKKIEREFKVPQINLDLVGTFSPADKPFRSIFESSDISDSNPFKEEQPFSSKDFTPFATEKRSLSPLSSPTSFSTTLSIGGMKVIPRRKVRSSLNTLQKVHSSKEWKHMRAAFVAWKERADELNSSMRLRDSISEIVPTPRSSVWTNDLNSSLEQSFEVVNSRAFQMRLSVQSEEIEEIITQELAYLSERCHLKLSFKYKGERFLPTLGPSVFPLFEELMDKKYAEIMGSVRGNKPVKSLSQFFCDELLPGRTFTREQLKVFGRFMVTVMRHNHDGHPYGQFICRLLRIDHPRPIFDNAGKIITQLRHESLQSNLEHTDGLQFYEQISVTNAFVTARKLFQHDEDCMARWLSALSFEGLNEIQTTVYWISLILFLDDCPTAFSDLFPLTPVPLDLFLTLPLHNALTDHALSTVFHFYCETESGLTSEAWERLITDGDFLRLANSSLPLCQLLEAVVDAFHDLQLRIGISVKDHFHGREFIQLPALAEVLRAVFPGLKPTAVNEVFRTACEIMCSVGDSVTSSAVIQAIIRLKLEVR